MQITFLRSRTFEVSQRLQQQKCKSLKDVAIGLSIH